METAPQRLERLRAELTRVWELECGSAAKRRDDVAAVEALASGWDDMVRRAFGAIDADFDVLAARGRPSSPADPLLCDIDLLGPLGLERRETVYTQAIRYLLDPLAAHGLGSRPLQVLLGQLKRRGVADVRLLDEAIMCASAAHVYAELAEYVVEGGEKERPRTDLWIEVPLSAATLVVVIENKVDGQLGEGQLEAYERLIAMKVSALRLAAVIRVLLTRDGDPFTVEGHEWLGLSHLQLAGALSSAAATDALGAHWLRLYLATVLRHIYRLRWRERPARREKAKLLVYLGEQFAEPA